MLIPVLLRRMWAKDLEQAAKDDDDEATLPLASAHADSRTTTAPPSTRYHDVTVTVPSFQLEGDSDSDDAAVDGDGDANGDSGRKGKARAGTSEGEGGSARRVGGDLSKASKVLGVRLGDGHGADTWGRDLKR